MGYRRLTADQALSLAPTLDKMSALREGQNALFAFENEEECTRVREAIYSWLFFKNLKALYRLRRVSPSELLVSRRAFRGPANVTVSAANEKIPAFVCEHLLGLSEHQVRKALAQALGTDQLTPEESCEALSEWKRINEVADTAS
jgi:hypothetical protein